jgi:hypothetical protein
MSEHTVFVEFGEHLPQDQISGMVTGLGAYGNVDAQAGGRAFLVHVFRESKLPRLQKMLTDWERYGFLRWQQRA